MAVQGKASEKSARTGAGGGSERLAPPTCRARVRSLANPRSRWMADAGEAPKNRQAATPVGASLLLWQL